MADDIWDGIFAEMKGESSKETQKRKRQNSFASSFSDPMFRFLIEIWIFCTNFFFRQQWFLNGGGRNGADMNVKPAWARGYTGDTD